MSSGTCTPASLALAGTPCDDLRHTIASGVADLGDIDAVLRLAPFMDEEAIRALEPIARAATGEEARAAILAIGFSRRADALGVLLSRPAAPTSRATLGLSLALLALGDGSGTGTIALALGRGDLALRRQTAGALAAMHQRRPALLLEGALGDSDEEVRYLAAKRSIETKEWRARGVLVGLLGSNDDERRERAFRVLAESGHHFRPEDLAKVSVHSRQHERLQRMLDTPRSRARLDILEASTLSERDAEQREVHLAFLAMHAAIAPERLRRAIDRAKSRRDSPAVGAMTMTLALLGDTASIDALAAFDAEHASHALRVLAAFAGGGLRARLESERASALARATRTWLDGALFDDGARGRLVHAMATLHPTAGLSLARSSLGDPGTAALLAALEIIGLYGSVSDIPALLEIARTNGPRLRAEAWRASLEICAH